MSVSTYVVENSLAQSLSAFQNVLSASEKSQFAKLATLPDVNAVLTFTAQLDERRAANQQRCTSSRIHDFLDSVKQFSSVVDTFVSSNPNVAALVWGSVKFTFVAIINVSFYFDKLSMTLMDLRHHFPRFADYQTLYPNSRRLKDALMRYFALTITFCQKTVEILKRSPLKQFSLAIWKSFETEFGKIIDEMKGQNKKVTQEIRYAADVAASKERQLQEAERNAQRKFRSSERALQAESEKRNRVRRNQRLMDQLTSHNHKIAYRKAQKVRLGDTCSWLTQSNEFKSWSRNPGLQVLHCSGKMGYGKTVSCAYVIDSILCDETLKNTYTPLFFFSQRAEVTSLNPQTIISSLIKQTLDSDSMSQQMTDQLSSILQNGVADSQELCSLLISRVREQSYMIILDGLDECEKSDRIILLDILKSVVQADRNRLKLYISSRPDLCPEIAKRIDISHSISVDRSGLKAISNYVHLAIGEKIKNEGFEVSNDMRLEIEEVLNEKSHGMYLWTFFQIEEICRQPSDDLIRTALKNLPRDLPETYERTLNRIYKNGPFQLVKQEFMWLSVTERPLSLNELQEALAIDPRDLSLQRHRFVNDKLALISQCAGLVSLDEEQHTVHFTHHSIHQFLTSASTPGSEYKWHFSKHEAEVFVGKACLTYLNFGDFERQVIKPGKTAVIHPEHVLDYSFRTVSNDKATRLYSKLFAFGSKKFNSDGAARIQIDLKKAFDIEQSTPEGYPFLKYAHEYWLFHCRRFTEKKSPEYRQWTALLQSENDMVQLPWHLDDLHNLESSVLSWIVNYSHMALVVYLYGMPPTSLLELTSPLKQVYIEAASRGNFELSNFIKSSMDTNSIDEDAFLAAASREHIEIVEMFFSPNTGSLTSISDDVLNTTVYEALVKEQFELARALSTKITKITSTAWNGETVLHAAALFGNLKIMNLLITGEKSTTINIQNSNGETALFVATRRGHLELVECLMSHAADINLTDCRGWSALQEATVRKHWSLVEKLLRAGSNANQTYECGYSYIPLCPTHCIDQNGSLSMTVLKIAAAEGHIKTVQHALSVGAHINTGSDSGFTALHIASAFGHLEIVKLLLAAGALVNQTTHSEEDLTAIELACSGGHLETVKCLLSAGANVDRDENGVKHSHALVRAWTSGRPEIVKLLLDAGALVTDTSQFDSRLEGAMLAHKGGHLEIMEYLLTVGANVYLPEKGIEQPRTLESASLERLVYAVRHLLSAGKDDDGSHENLVNLLMEVTSQHGHLEILECVLSTGTDANVSQGKNRALQSAVFHGKTDLIERLLLAGADANYRNENNENVLHLAALHGNTDLVERLLLAGADVNLRNADNKTALHLVAQLDDTDLVERLLLAGADVNLRNKLNMPALDLAILLNEPKTIKWLKNPRVQRLLKRLRNAIKQ